MKLRGGIFVKLLAIFLLIGLAPLLVLGVTTYHKARARMTETVIEYWLVRIARETAVQLDREVQEMHALVRSWADDDFLATNLLVVAGNGDSAAWSRERLEAFLENRRNYRQDLDLLMLVDAGGRIMAASWASRASLPATAERILDQLLEEVLPDPPEREWIQHALTPTAAAIQQARVPISTRDWHVSPLVRLAQGLPPWDPRQGYPKSDQAYSLGFASTILADSRQRAVGALVALFSWSRIQGVLDQVGQRFKERDDPLRESSRYRTGYPFLFANDFDTIIAHDDKRLLGNSLSRDHGLPDFRDRMRQASYGSYQYEYPAGTPKISGYAYAARPAQGGFGWTVGVGINHEEIYADVNDLRAYLVLSALSVTGLVILMAAAFSHRITDPITRLTKYTAEVAQGHLDARVSIRTHDEISTLADSFNRMVEDLKESNRRLIKAEKDAAWKEMARQVAHEIKNPLTPIMLSVQQLRQAHADGHPDFAEILHDSVATIIDQCEALRRIAADFADFAAFPRRHPRRQDLASLVQNAVDLYRPRVRTGVEVVCDIRTPPGLEVEVDREELRRVFLNLFNNAMEAMGEIGGRLTVTTELPPGDQGSRVLISVSDTGPGIPEESRTRLFEPYFSTRSGGTGLGLAICKRIVEEHSGSISFQSGEEKGTTFIISLPAFLGPESPPP